MVRSTSRGLLLAAALFGLCRPAAADFIITFDGASTIAEAGFTDLSQGFRTSEVITGIESSLIGTGDALGFREEGSSFGWSFDFLSDPFRFDSADPGALRVQFTYSLTIAPSGIAAETFSWSLVIDGLPGFSLLTVFLDIPSLGTTSVVTVDRDVSDVAGIFDTDLRLRIRYSDGDGSATLNAAQIDDVRVLGASAVSVPEPLSAVLLGLGGVGLVGAARRRRGAAG